MGVDEVTKVLKQHTLDRDNLEFSTGDVIDVKTGLLLVMLVFLAGQAEGLFKGTLGTGQRYLGWLSIVAIVAGGLLAVLELLPRKYKVLSMPAEFQSWISGVQRAYSDYPDGENEVLILVEEAEIAEAIKRVEENVLINKRKVFLMKACFYCVIGSFSANMFALASNSLSRLYR